MKTIYKYPVRMLENFTVEAPHGAEFFAVQVQGDEVQMWARVDTKYPLNTYRFGVFGTGHVLSGVGPTAPHIGTFQLSGGALVFHLFGGEQP